MATSVKPNYIAMEKRMRGEDGVGLRQQQEKLPVSSEQIEGVR